MFAITSIATTMDLSNPHIMFEAVVVLVVVVGAAIAAAIVAVVVFVFVGNKHAQVLHIDFASLGEREREKEIICFSHGSSMTFSSPQFTSSQCSPVMSPRLVICC